jgi:hypothetical protein
MDYTASSLYGGMPGPQATSTPTPDHGPATPAPMARTAAATGGRGPALTNPTLLLVVLVGAAIGLVHMSVRVG